MSIKVFSSSGMAAILLNWLMSSASFEEANMVVRRNGYLYVYVSNESNQFVYFDNLTIQHRRGPVVEQHDYYAFGLEIPGLSTQAAKPSTYNQNWKKTYQGQKHDTVFGLDTYEFKYRMDDPEIGRFRSIDPLANKYPYNSTYAFSEDKVTSHIELEGLEAIPFGGVYNCGPCNSSNRTGRSDNSSSQNEANKPKEEKKSEQAPKQPEPKVSGWGGYKPKITAAISVTAGGAMNLKDAFGVKGGQSEDLIGIRDNSIEFMGKNENGNEEKRTGLEVDFVGYGAGTEKTEEKKDGNWNTTKTTEKTIVAGFIEHSIETDNKTGKQETTININMGFSIGIGLVIDVNVQIPIYKSSN